MHYNFTNSNGVKSITLIGRETQVLSEEHPKFAQLQEFLCDNPNPVEDDVWNLVNGAENAILSMAEKLSERVQYRHGSILFDGDVVDNSLTRHILRMIDEGDEEFIFFVKFLENLSANPSKLSRLQLFRWLDNRDFTITEDGCFLGYKGVSTNGFSVSHGGAFVDGVWVDGNVPNKKGTVIEFPRSKVDPERAVACSTGLHVGTYEYAKRFAPRLLLVKVNPRDVVSVPSDASDQKIRCCRYVIVEDSGEQETPVEFVETTTWEPAEDDIIKEYDGGRGNDWSDVDW